MNNDKHSDRAERIVRVTVAAFYKFVDIDDPETLQSELRKFCSARDIKGTILIASEGINATISGPDGDIAAVVDELRSDKRFANLAAKFSSADVPRDIRCSRRAAPCNPNNVR